MPKSIVKWILLSLLILIAAVAAVIAILPIETDPIIMDEDSGAGVRSIMPSDSDLRREFPPVEAPDPDQVELGRQLFFDPILSGNNDISCATCHHPDKGFSDGRTVPETPDGVKLRRNSPTIWGIGYANALFHDGRVQSLEAQAEMSLLESSEMNADPAETIIELAAIPGYVELFQAAFGVDSITFMHITSALAAFERTITATDTPFDHFAAGDSNALTAAQQRGLSIFHSSDTRCFECHINPTFASDTFRVIGVESADLGRVEVFDRSPPGSFRVPTLRNIALTAPYMHNGSMETLEEVVQFYADGGGRQFGDDNPHMDMFVQGFDLNAQERDDLVAFMHALTDESQLPEVPAVALSGLSTIERVESAARATTAAMNAAMNVE